MPRHKAAIHTSDVAFSPTVKAIQSRKGSRAAYAKMEARGSWPSTITDELAAFIKAQTSVYLATVNTSGQPYIQHRGGPPGFLRVLDGKTIGFADFAGNRQYITSGNLSDNPKAHLFFMDYTNLRRVKIWGTACVVEDDANLIDTLMPKEYEARPEQALLFTVVAWDTNCPQHIPRRFDAADIAMVVAARDDRIAELESEIRRFKNEDALDV